MKYGRFKYGQGVYSPISFPASYTAPATVSTNYTAPTVVTTNWDLQLRHTYGAKASTTVRATYGEHIRYGGIPKVEYKFNPINNYFSP